MDRGGYEPARWEARPADINTLRHLRGSGDASESHAANAGQRHRSYPLMAAARLSKLST